MTLDPQLRKQWLRFRRNKRAFYSLVLLTAAFGLSLLSNLLINYKPLLVKYEGTWSFPVFQFYPGVKFGGENLTEAEYRELKDAPQFQKAGNWILMPPVPYGPNESMPFLTDPPPTQPTWQNILGTDDRGRDILTRLVYGFRNSMIFALISWVFVVLVAYVTGALQGYLGGRVDFLGQRAIEIWGALPVLYVIIFLLSILPANLSLLTLVWVAFSWMGLSSYVRVEVLRVRRLDFVLAAQGLGAGLLRILFRHVLPNTLTPILTFSPFIISASVFSLAALDYLGLGLPPPTPSWGELLKQGKENFTSWWIGFYSFLSLFLTLLLLNFIGEGVRSAFDAREK